MIFEGVNFNEQKVRAMGLDEFIERHINDFWKDKSKATRRQMLKRIYRVIASPPVTSKSK